MKKIILFIATTLLLCLNIQAEIVFTFTSSADLTQTKDEVTITLAQGSGQKAPNYNETWNPEMQPSDMRLYVGNTITVSSTNMLTDIQMVFAKSCASGKNYTGLSADQGKLVSGGTSESFSDWKVDSWTGNTTSVVFTLTGEGQRQIQRIVIDGEPIIIDSIVTVLPTEADLDLAYVYTEPTTIGVKDTTILKKEYAFIADNILVHCTQGSILKATDTTVAYFNCNAGERMTFTATRPIKGLAINGAVRKLFTATANKGKMSYLQPDEFYWEDYQECEPVIIIKDIDSTAVTITCNKQLRCYSIQFYFEANPTAKIGCGDVINEGFDELNEDNRMPLKILHEGHVYIHRDKQVYTIDGQRVTITY